MKKKILFPLFTGTLLACFFLLYTLSSSLPQEEMIVEKQIFSITETEKISLIALGNEDVPVGRYGKDILVAMSLWDDLEGKISYASNVKEVLTQVELGSVDCGIVYRTDANSSNKVEIIEILDSNLLETPVIYPVSLLENSQHPLESACFLDFLGSKTAREVFTDYGFTVLGEEIQQDSIILDSCNLTIFAASSLTESLSFILEKFQEEHEGIEFLVNFDSSGTLATQIEYGATADIFLSASNAEIIRLTEAGFLEETNSFSLLENEIVLIRGK
ncbi:MAG: molybdate ABC transporter substrate-binding protein [Eubacteriales bacterium]